MDLPADHPASGHGLPPHQRAALEAADARARPVLRAAKLAAFNGWTLAMFAVLSIVVGLFSLTSLVVGLCLGVLAWNELRGRTLVRALDPRGPALLWRNQLWLLGLIVAYCAWGVFRAWTEPLPELRQLEMAAGIPPGLVLRLTLAAYAVVIVVTAVVLGLLARYHHRRVAMLRAYLAETPAWIVDVQRSVLG